MSFTESIIVNIILKTNSGLIIVKVDAGKRRIYSNCKQYLLKKQKGNPYKGETKQTNRTTLQTMQRQWQTLTETYTGLQEANKEQVRVMSYYGN